MNPGTKPETPLTDALEFQQECNYDVCWEDHAREQERRAIAAEAEVGRLRAALERAKSEIIDGKVYADYDATIDLIKEINKALAKQEGAPHEPA